MPADPSIIERKLKALEFTMERYLSPREKKIVMERAATLLKESYLIKGIQALVKDVTQSKWDRNNFFNHLVELNLVYYLSEVKNKMVGVERRVRPDSRKRVYMVLPGEKTLYIEVKNINEPEMPWLKKRFYKVMSDRIQEIKGEYFIHFVFIRQNPPTFSEDELEDVARRVKRGLGRQGEPLFYYPTRARAVLSFSFERCLGLDHLEIGHYGYGRGGQYTLYGDRFLELEIERKMTALENPSCGVEERKIYQKELKKYRLLRENSNNLMELELKQSLLRGIKDAEEKLLPSGREGVNVLLIHYGWELSRSLSLGLIKDVVQWYYGVATPRRTVDRWREYYDIWAEEEGFRKAEKIDSFVCLLGKGIEEAFQWEILYLRPGKEEVRGIFS